MRTTPDTQRIAAAAEVPRFYSVAQVARMLGMSPMTLYRAIAAGHFPAVRIRGRLIVPAKAIEAMADAAIADQTVVDASGWVPREAVLR
jgi:excisionase family DNA binding protein